MSRRSHAPERGLCRDQAVAPCRLCCGRPESDLLRGQPAYNSGDREGAKTVAATTIRAFARFDFVVVPSGSCAAMIRRHYPSLFDGDPALAQAAAALADKTYELTQFLSEIMPLERVPAKFDGRVAYHDSCSGLRELGVKSAPRRLLATVEGLELVELPGAEDVLRLRWSLPASNIRRSRIAWRATNARKSLPAVPTRSWRAISAA